MANGATVRDSLRTIGTTELEAAARVLAKLDPVAPLAQQLDAVEELARFVIAGPATAGAATRAQMRLELLVVALERMAPTRERFIATLRSIFEQTGAIKLFGEVGLPNDRGLLAEITDRLARHVLPEPPNPHELWWLASRIFRKPRDLAWLGAPVDPLLERLAAITCGAWEPLRVSILDAITLITARIASLGTDGALRTRASVSGVRASPLYQIGLAPPEELSAWIPEARRYLDEIRGALDDKGVSVDVVYALDTIERGLSRLELLLPFAVPGSALAPYAIRAVIAATGNGIIGLRSLRQVLADNTRLLARKVIERAGHTGEHYVTSSRREYWTMFRSAVGGGGVIVFLTAGKFLIKWGHFAPFVDAVLASAAYSAAFVIMQLLGLTLATKQPSMTAAALAGSIREHGGPGQLDALVPLIARIARSQFAAIIGNVFAVIVVALLFDAVHTQITGAPFFDRETAVATAKSLDPIRSWTIVFAMLTGVQLWLSSLCAGWFENWIVYRRIPDALAHRPRFARFLERHAAGFGGSISLGILFGFIPQIGAFFGVTLDGRHITITTTSLVLSTTSAGIDGIGGAQFAWSCLGLVIIALCNFGVSFTLALLVALRAREVPRGERLLLPAAVFRHFLRHPLSFFVPPRSAAAH